MAISMSAGKIDSSERESLLGQTVDNSANLNDLQTNGIDIHIPGTNTSNLEGNEAKLAGITATFATDVTAKIDSYITTVQGHINSMANVASTSAFKGETLNNKISSFIKTISFICNDYVSRLHSAENQIINSVSAAYQQQDTDIAGDLISDSAQTLGNNIDVNRYPGGIMLGTPSPQAGGGTGPSGAH